MNHLDTFAGIGGFSLAARWVWGDAHRVVAFVEKDPFCQKVLTKHWPGVPIHGDIKEFDGKQYRGAVDILTGGFPCQPFSQAGPQLGTEDDRHLWPEMFRVIEESRPRWVLGENVTGIIRMALDDVLSEMEGAGYSCEAIVIPACATGAPHRRDRVWIVAHDTSDGCGQGRAGRSDSGSAREREQAFPAVADADGARPQGWSLLPERAVELVAGAGSVVRHAAVAGLPDWSGGEVGEPRPLTEFERPGGREIERDFRGVPHGVSNRVDRLRALGNAIAPAVAYEILRCIKQIDEQG